MSETGFGGVAVSEGLRVGPVPQRLTRTFYATATIDPAAVAANTSAEQTFTVAGLVTGMVVYVNKPTTTAGLGIVGCRVSATDTLAITFGNFTAAPIDPASEVYSVIGFSGSAT